jgi:hypothetical protein
MTCYLCSGEGGASGGRARVYLCAWCMRDLGYAVDPGPRVEAPAPAFGKLVTTTTNDYTMTTYSSTATPPIFPRVFLDLLTPKPFCLEA